ncbi:MAG: hypothetical protein ACXQS4_05150 [Methermicoccaceae archaeon]
MSRKTRAPITLEALAERIERLEGEIDSVASGLKCTSDAVRTLSERQWALLERVQTLEEAVEKLGDDET